VKKGFLGHSFEQVLFVLILVLAIFLLEFFRDSTIRLAIKTTLSLLYIAIGVFHHLEEKNLRPSQILEHTAIGAIIFVILSAIYG
jgi:hypothetical protein